MSNANTQSVAVIGAGISGLSCAYFLYNHGGGEARFKVSLFEAEPRIGGHTATKIVNNHGKQWAIDTGFIVYNDWTYPNFIRLLNEIGIDNQVTDMSFSVSCQTTGLEYSGSSINTFFAQRLNLLRLNYWRMLTNILRFNRQAVADLQGNKIPGDITLGEYLRVNGYSGLFESHYLVPMCAAIWSASTDVVQQFPLLFFVRFFKNHGLLSVNDRPQWRVIKGGSHSYLEPLTKKFRDHIHCNVQIAAVRREARDVVLVMQDGSVQRFDHVVFACHSDQALALLADASKQEQRVLGAMPYQTNDVVLHTDENLLPRNRRAWAAWNYLLNGDKQECAVLSYNMNILQSLECDTTFCVTLNATDKIDPDKILGQYNYSHPVFSLTSVAAQERWPEINGVNHTWYCGAYWGNGFHEDGVNSALRVAEGLGVTW